MQDNTAPGAEIKCDGTPLAQQTAQAVTDIVVESRLGLPGSFAVTLTDRSLAFIGSEDGPLHEGVRLEIALGYDKKYQTLITGEISTVSAEMSTQGIFARIAGYDMLHRLSRGTNYRCYDSGDNEAMTDSNIVRTILNDAGLKPTIDDTPERSVPRTQDNRSDLDFLAMLAGLNDYHLYSEEDRVFFTSAPPDRGELTLAWGKNLRAFYPRLCLNGLVKTFEARGRDVSLGENYVESFDRPREDLLFLSPAGRDMVERGSGGRSVLNLHDALVTSANDAKQFISGAMRERQAIVTASGSCIGNCELRAGTVLKIEDAARFNGKYFVTRAIHRFNGKGYITEFEARMTP